MMGKVLELVRLSWRLAIVMVSKVIVLSRSPRLSGLHHLVLSILFIIDLIDLVRVIEQGARSRPLVSKSRSWPALVFNRLNIFIFSFCRVVRIKRLVGSRIRFTTFLRPLLLPLEFFPVDLAHVFGGVGCACRKAIVVLLSLCE